MINYSIIIPHKNSVQLLERCLSSIPVRPDIQVVVVDDCSNDVGLLNKVINKYKHVELILTSEKKGAGYARNIGLDKIKGKWLLFADADDFFNKGWVEVLDKKYLNSDLDLVFFDVNTCNSDTLKPAPLRSRELHKGILTKDVEYLRWKVRVVWGKMYSTSLIKQYNIRCDEVLACNDVKFSCLSSYYSKSIGIENSTLYCSTINTNSLCYKMTIENLDSRLAVNLWYNEFVHKINRGKYQINILSLLLFYRRIDNKLFYSRMMEYLKKASLKMLFYDIKLTFEGGVRILFSGHNPRNAQKVLK